MSNAKQHTNNKSGIAKNSLMGGLISINDLRDKDFAGISLTEEEQKAINNFDKYRIEQLSKQANEKDFHNKYIQLQAMANLSPYSEFLKEEYQ
jgi:hypothetical protein